MRLPWRKDPPPIADFGPATSYSNRDGQTGPYRPANNDQDDDDQDNDTPPAAGRRSGRGQ